MKKIISHHGTKLSSQNEMEEKEFLHTCMEKSVFPTSSYAGINPCRPTSLSEMLTKLYFSPPPLTLFNKYIFRPFWIYNCISKDFVFSFLFLHCQTPKHHLNFRWSLSCSSPSVCNSNTDRQYTPYYFINYKQQEK